MTEDSLHLLRRRRAKKDSSAMFETVHLKPGAPEQEIAEFLRGEIEIDGKKFESYIGCHFYRRGEEGEYQMGVGLLESEIHFYKKEQYVKFLLKFGEWVRKE